MTLSENPTHIIFIEKILYFIEIIFTNIFGWYLCIGNCPPPWAVGHFEAAELF